MNSAIQQFILVLRCEGTASYQYTEAVAEKYRPIEGEKIIERWILNTWISPQIELLGCQKKVRCPNLQLGCDFQNGLIRKRIQRTKCELPNMAVTDHNICLSSKYLKLSTKFFCALQPLPAFCRHELKKVLSDSWNWDWETIFFEDSDTSCHYDSHSRIATTCLWKLLQQSGWWIFQTNSFKMAAAPDPEVNRPPELSKARVDSWSHLNSDKPILHSHALKISRFRQCLDQFETSMFIQDSFSVNVAGIKTNWELRYDH